MDKQIRNIYKCSRVVNCHCIRYIWHKLEFHKKNFPSQLVVFPFFNSVHYITSARMKAADRERWDI